MRPAVDTARRADVLDSTNKLYRKLYDDGYFKLVAEVPSLVEWGYDSNDVPFDLARTLKFWDRINTTATVKAIKAARPDVVVCTHFLPARLVSLMLTRGSLNATTFGGDHRLRLPGPVADQSLQRVLRRPRGDQGAYVGDRGARPIGSRSPGSPSDPCWGSASTRPAVRRRFGLRDDLPVVLISAGAAGGSYTKTIVQQALALQTPFQAVIVCGRNDGAEAGDRRSSSGIAATSSRSSATPRRWPT